MTWSFSLGRLFGSELRVHLTFFLLLAWVGFAAYAQAGPAAAVRNLLFILARTANAGDDALWQPGVRS